MVHLCLCGSKNQKEHIYIGRIKRQFLMKKNGPVARLETNCCVRQQTRLSGVGLFENISEFLPKDVNSFKTADIISKADMVLLKGGCG